MYLHPLHAERDPATLHEFLRANPLGVLTTAIPHERYDTIQSTHIPWVLNTDDDLAAEAKADLGLLRGHLARVNPQSKVMMDHLTARAAAAADTAGVAGGGGGGATRADPLELADDVCVLFTAPVHGYVTAKYMVETKQSTAKVVPTWQFAAVQVYGRARVFHANDDTSSDFLQDQVSALTEQSEDSVLVPGEEPWELHEAPPSYVDALKKRIVGIEIRITKMEGRYKLGQDETDGDWKGIRDGFQATGTEHGRCMAAMMEKSGAAKRPHP